ncbi:methionyl aminopeptidase [Terrimicrobium sacchariphilum]|jgi:methionyl aminopeptidase|uniref:Methionine aminopeptidase n=1 Tax=Terrimicrobium sacchariphilum TaxID=690879 RepID=A0A146GB39_TERSA|nr:type I methionyl aminopeptidase [Terrimicrobium sacchariphilum]GAT34849.1 methionyl aminopeptidase [Terrimicrobium sacchariphilum]
MIPIKRGPEIQKMRKAGETAANILNRLADLIAPGVTTGEIDHAASQYMAEAGVKSAFHGYKKFPGYVCISLNEEVVHGIGGPRKIQYGDIVKLDVGVVQDGWIGDTAASIPVGIISPEAEQLLTVSEQSLNIAVSLARAGTHLGDVCASVEEHVSKYGYTVVREFVGHGVGRSLHEEPQIPNFGRRGTGPTLRAGMTLAIEPMVNMGTARVKLLSDKWTVVTQDGRPSAHFEHTVLVTDGDPEVLTWPRKTLLK